MTRAEAKDFLKTKLGIEEVTDEMVSNYLNSVQKEVTSSVENVQKKADQYKQDAEKVKELQGKIKELEDANLSEADKAAKDLEELNERLAQMEKENERMKTLNALADKGIVGEDAENLIREDGSIDFETLGKIITDRENAAAIKKEKDIAGKSTNPGGGADKPKDEKTDDVKNAEGISFGTFSKQEEKDYYKL